MLTIKIFGPGCANCKRVEQIARRVTEQLGLEAEFVKVTDFNEIVDQGVVNTPGLAVNERVVCSGRIPSEAEVTTWVTTALAAA